MYRLQQEAPLPLSWLSSLLGGHPPPHPPPGWVNIDGVTLILSVTPVEINWVVIAVFDPFPLSAASHLSIFTPALFSPHWWAWAFILCIMQHPQFKNKKWEDYCDAFWHTQNSDGQTGRGGEESTGKLNKSRKWGRWIKMRTSLFQLPSRLRRILSYVLFRGARSHATLPSWHDSAFIQELIFSHHPLSEQAVRPPPPPSAAHTHVDKHWCTVSGAAVLSKGDLKSPLELNVQLKKAPFLNICNCSQNPWWVGGGRVRGGIHMATFQPQNCKESSPSFKKWIFYPTTDCDSLAVPPVVIVLGGVKGVTGVNINRQLDISLTTC